MVWVNRQGGGVLEAHWEDEVLQVAQFVRGNSDWHSLERRQVPKNWEHVVLLLEWWAVAYTNCGVLEDQGKQKLVVL